MRAFRVGTFTSEIMFIAIGIIWFLSNFYSNISWGFFLKIWPLILVLLGLEVLFQFWLGKTDELRFDIWSILITIFIFFVSSVAYVFSPAGFLYKEVTAVIRKPVYAPIERTISGATIDELVIRASRTSINLVGHSDNDQVIISANLAIKKENVANARKKLENKFRTKIVGKKLYITLESNNSFLGENNEFEKSSIDISFPKEKLVRIEEVTGKYLSIENTSASLTIVDSKTYIDL